MSGVVPSRLPLAFVGAILWLGLGMAFTFLDNDSSRRLYVLSSMTVIFSAWVFLRHGGPYITAAGVWSVCSGLFVGFAGLYWYMENHVTQSMADAVGYAFLVHAAMYYLLWRGKGLVPPDRTGPTSKEATVGFFPVGLALLAVGTALSIAEVAEVVAGPAAFLGIILVAISLFGREGRRIKFIPVLFTSILAFVYARYVFSGYGRIVLAALAFALAMIIAIRFRSYAVKIATLVVIPPALMVLVNQREQFGLEQFGTELNGIGSVVEPLRDFSRLLGNPSAYEPGMGSTFWAALVTHVPSAVWEGKPPGFGLELVWIFNPSVASIGGSMAALAHGEWIFNFGPFGLVLMLVPLGLVIRWLDRGLLSRIRSGLSSRSDVVVLAAGVIVASGMTDLFWGGTHTFMSRAGTRLLLLAFLYLLWVWGASRKPSISAQGRARFHTTQERLITDGSVVRARGRLGALPIRPK